MEALSDTSSSLLFTLPSTEQFTAAIEGAISQQLKIASEADDEAEDVCISSSSTKIDGEPISREAMRTLLSNLPRNRKKARR